MLVADMLALTFMCLFPGIIDGFVLIKGIEEFGLAVKETRRGRGEGSAGTAGASAPAQ